VWTVVHKGTDQPSPAQKIGKMVADHILEDLRGRNPGASEIWAMRLLGKLGSIGKRLLAHPIPDDTLGPPRCAGR
jgi:hypothetical protein